MNFKKTHNKYKKDFYIPRGLLLQWHITERCNLRCSHCYQSDYSGQELQFDNLLKVLDQFKDLLSLWRRKVGRLPVRGHITVTGGEPFIRRDFLDLLEIFSANKHYFSFAILTNGSFIDAAMARRLRKLGPAFVQVSVEGTQATHDKIRDTGNFDRTVSALKHLVKEHIRTLISFTAHRDNFREFSEVAQLGRKLRVSRVWADRLIPSGTGLALQEQMLTSDETREFFEIMLRARRKAKRHWFSRTEIAMHRALQFLVAGGKPYHCTAGDTLVTVQPNGDLYPCRRMPIRVGNLMETPLAELYYESSLFRALRNRNCISDDCQSCFYSKLCRGGLKCLSYAMTGDPFKADPGCWRTLKEYQAVGLEKLST
jgi:radical SAM protein with 4Fe4S-binding SPASM domain